MTRATIVGGALVVLAAGVVAVLTLGQIVDLGSRPSNRITPAIAAEEGHPSFLYGRVTINGGATFEGRLRWGRGEEAFWGDYFNGFRDGNTWAVHVPRERMPQPVKIFGVEVATREGHVDLSRPFMARFGDIVRIEHHGRVVRVKLKSGTVFDVNWGAANDFADDVRVWDRKQGALDLDDAKIRIVELLPAHSAGPVPNRLHGMVRTRQGDFTGFIQWNRNDGLGSDAIDGRTADGNLSLRFDTIRSISRQSGDSALVTLVDGREIVLSGTPESGRDNLGMYVDDRRYGRVLVSWDAFERLDFSSGGSGPTYNDFPPGRPLTGSVTTRAGRRIAGRLVYDLDEGETTETLDASSKGVDYTIPFGLVASIAFGRVDGSPRAKVTLHNGEELQFDRTGDLAEGTAGMLIFVDGGSRSEYVIWPDVERIEFDRPAAMYPPQGR